MKVVKIQDDDFHWYWILNTMLPEFKTDFARIKGKEYMSAPDDFDNFNQKYTDYRTLGSPDVTPSFYEGKNVSFSDAEDLAVFSEEETIEQLAGCNYSPRDIAIYLSKDVNEFLAEFKDLESEIRLHYDRGRLIADFEINEKLLTNAKAGNITAAQVFEKNRDRVQTENLKNQIYFA